MYKVVVIDDEPLILRSIKKSIEDAHKGFVVVGEAMNGEDAIHIVENLAPDLIFTDIRMPVIDGLALIEELHKRLIQPKVVILSGFQEFDYAKRALKFGVEEYLLKPIAHDELNELLNKIYDDLDNLKNNCQYQFLESMASKDINQKIPQQIPKCFDEYNFFGSILICSGSLCTFICNWFTPAKEYWFKTDLNTLLSNILKEEYKYWILDLNNGNEKLIILGTANTSHHEYNSICKQIYDKLVEEDFPVTFIVGTPMNFVCDLPYAIQYCKIELNKSIIFGGSKLIYLDVTTDSGKNIEPIINANTEKLLLMYIENNQFQQFKLELKNLLDSYNSSKSHQFRLQSLLKYLVNLFQSRISHLSQNRLMEIEMEIDELISNSYKYQTIYEGMSIIFDDLFTSAKMQFTGNSDQKALIDKVENYIRQNYSQQISLQSIAENYGLVLPYLSSIFKKYKGISPMEFIINLRIEKVKELLQITPPLLLKDISFSVGYDDPYYMSRIFKSVTGKSPSEYRSSS